jgi:hypothetical protein
VSGTGGVTLGDVISWIRDGGVIVCLVLVLYGALNEWWVTGRQYRRMLRERDLYREELFQVLGMTDRASQALDRATHQVIVGRREFEVRRGRTEAERNVRVGGTETDE